jgi:Cu2+-exporting ATPase
MVGIGKGAENGILIKDAEALELGYKVNVVVLDKTGTITEGKPVVTDLIWAKNIGQDINQLQACFLAMERLSEHPLADAVSSYLQSIGTSSVNVDSFESLTGRGVEAVHDKNIYYAGSHKLVEEKGIAIPIDLQENINTQLSLARTVIYFADAKQVLAIVAITDQIKKNSAEAISQLKKQGIKVFMLTGDNAQTAAAIAKEAGIDHFKADILPSDKAAFVKQLQAEGNTVAMIGDGINDSEALAQADVSIAMGQGSDIAIDVARITLVSSDLQQVPKALRLSQLTVRTIRQNLFWAFIYNLIGIPIAAGILYPINGFLLNPMIAGAAMALSSVSVVSNSLRLKISKLNL